MSRWTKLGIIAGGGALPVRIADSLRAQQKPFFAIRMVGFGDAPDRSLGGEECALGEFGKLLRLLRDNSCDAVVLAGAAERPDFSKVKTDWRGAAMLPRILTAATRGDGAILRAAVDALEAEGFLVIGADEAMGELVAREGALGKFAPNATDIEDIKKAVGLIEVLDPFDVGQAAVVAQGHVRAIEAAAGTDAMLAQCAALPSSVKGGQPSGVIVKRPKPSQERRVDLPVIGPTTIARAHAAGLRGVAVEAGGALIIDREQAITRADELSLFVYGFSKQNLLS
ncbi:MAG: UDP-2,3-diacylglucosamine diphosphatase LpxI [Pseudomonadota bacterium]